MFLVGILLASELALALCVCPPGSVQGLRLDECYVYATEALSWTAAETYCVERDGHLTSISNAFVNSFLLTMPNVRLETDYFVGGSSGLLDNRDNWTWVDGSKFAYTNWKSGRSL